MLVLTRHIGEEIVIAGNIRVVVVKIIGKKVRLGFQAPAGIPVVRRELFDRDAAAVAKAAQTQLASVSPS